MKLTSYKNSSNIEYHFIITIDNMVYDIYSNEKIDLVEGYRYFILDNKQLNKLKKIYGYDIYDYDIILCTDFFKVDQEFIYNTIFRKGNVIDNYRKWIDKIRDRVVFKNRRYDLFKYKSLSRYTVDIAQEKNRQIIKAKNELDIEYTNLPQRGYSNIFSTEENGNDRYVVIIDINSFYPYLLTKNIYPHPLFLKKSHNVKILDNSIIVDNKEIDGRGSIFKANMRYINHSEFINKFHHIILKNGYRSFTPSFNIGDSFDTYLTYSEIIYYSKYFDIDIDYIIYSEKIMYSPLSTYVKKLYKYKYDEDISPIVKNMLTYIYSVNKQRLNIIETREFDSEQDIVDYFEKYGIKIDMISGYSDKNLTILNMYRRDGKIVLKYRLNRFWENRNNILSHYYTLHGEGRIEMLKYIEELVDMDLDIDIHYVNIDSIHFSIPQNNFNKWRERFKHNIGRELGKFKIEGVGDRGYWLSYGSYWIFNRDEVIKYSNCLPQKKREYSSKKIVEFNDLTLSFNRYYIDNCFNLYNRKIVKKRVESLSFKEFLNYDKIKYNIISDNKKYYNKLLREIGIR